MAARSLWVAAIPHAHNWQGLPADSIWLDKVCDLDLHQNYFFRVWQWGAGVDDGAFVFAAFPTDLGATFCPYHPWNPQGWHETTGMVSYGRGVYSSESGTPEQLWAISDVQYESTPCRWTFKYRGWGRQEDPPPVHVVWALSDDPLGPLDSEGNRTFVQIPYPW
jgi:hypothetical protein